MKPLKKHPKQQRMEEMTFPIFKEKGSALTLDKLEAMEKDMRKGFKNGSMTATEVAYDHREKRRAERQRAKFPASATYYINNKEVVVELKLDTNKNQRNDKITWEGREYLRSINDDLGFTLMPRIVWRVVAVGVLVGAVIYFLSKYGYIR